MASTSLKAATGRSGFTESILKLLFDDKVCHRPPSESRWFEAPETQFIRTMIFFRRMAPPARIFHTAILLITIASLPIWAQNATTSDPQFEVASIKPSAPGSRGPTIYNPTPERFAITSITIKALIAYAYDVRDFQISGGPAWSGSQSTTSSRNRKVIRATRGSWRWPGASWPSDLI